MSNSVVLLQPTPTINIIGAVSNARISGTVSLTLPIPKLQSAASNLGTVLTLPTPVLTVRGETALVATVGLVLPTPKLIAKGETTNVGTVSLTLPTPVLQAHGANAVTLTLPVPRIAVTGATGRIGYVQLVLPTPVLAASGKVPFTGGILLVLPKPQLAITGRVGNYASVALALRGIALAAEGATGIIGSAHLTLPTPVINVAGYQQGRGTVTLVLPMLILQSTGQVTDVTTSSPDGNVLPAVVMQTETGALSNYTNFPFNSFAAFNGAYLGASAEGLFVLTGDTDNTTFIQAAARVGITDFGTSFLKRIDRCYVGYRTDGNLIVRVFTDEVNVRDYLMTAYGKDGLHGNHTRIGKGLAARYWQFEIRNQNGAQFQINAFELKPTHLRRRIGGGDA